MAYSLSPWLKPRFFITGTNRPLAGGLMYTYKAGTTDPATTYSDDSGTTNTNPIVLDSDGQCDLFLDDAVSYRIILKNSAGVTQFDKDRIASIGSTQVQSFNSIAALRLRSGTTIANAAKTLGYYSAGDGGGNSFYWDGTSTDTDNGGTIIKPTAVSGAGRWIAVDTSYITPEMFGAKGDGINDDTIYIVAAVAALTTLGGGSLVFSRTYRLTENSTGSTQTRFTISSDNVTIVFLSKAKFLVKSDSAMTIIFALAGVSYFKTIGTLHVESDASTPYTTSGAYGAKALVIYNANGKSSEHITIDKVVIKRGSGGVFIQNAYAASNRVTNVSINEIRTFDTTYGFNAQNNGDGVDISLVYTYNAYRSYFAYGCESHRANVEARAPHTGGTPLNLTTYSVVEGGSGVNTDNMVINLSVSNGGLESTIATIRNIGDGGASQKVSNIQLRIHTDYAPTNVLALFNFDTDGGSASATAFAAKIENIFIECNTPLATTPLVYSPCSWITRPTVIWRGMSGATTTQIRSYQQIVDFRVTKKGSQYFLDDIVLENNISLTGLSTSNVVTPLAKLDTSNNTLYGASSAAATYTALYGGANGIYFNVNGASRFQMTDSQFRPHTDNSYTLGNGSQRFSVVYAGTGTINTSDERLKQQISDLSPELKAWAKVNFCKYKFNDAVEIKGDGARWHIGVIAQQVKEAFESEGLDPFAYGLLCYDEWDETDELIDGDGVVITPKVDDGNRYGIRYEEALVLECAYLRSKIK
jgi:hypothetical protein